MTSPNTPNELQLRMALCFNSATLNSTQVQAQPWAPEHVSHTAANGRHQAQNAGCSNPQTFSRCCRELTLLAAETGADWESERALASAYFGVTGMPPASGGAQHRARLICMNSSRPAVEKNCRQTHRQSAPCTARCASSGGRAAVRSAAERMGVGSTAGGMSEWSTPHRRRQSRPGSGPATARPRCDRTHSPRSQTP